MLAESKGTSRVAIVAPAAILSVAPHAAHGHDTGRRSVGIRTQVSVRSVPPLRPSLWPPGFAFGGHSISGRSVAVPSIRPSR